MKKTIVCAAALALALVTPAMSRASTYFGFQIGVSNAPRPPRVVFYQHPREVYIPDEQVYVVDDDDYDVFRYGGSYYVCNDGYWYRARAYNGPWIVVDARYVPRPIYSVPVRYWRHRDHWGPSRVRYVETRYYNRPVRYAPRQDMRWTPNQGWRWNDDRRPAVRDDRGQGDWNDRGQGNPNDRGRDWNNGNGHGHGNGNGHGNGRGHGHGKHDNGNEQ
jgi:hypothetical protein